MTVQVPEILLIGDQSLALSQSPLGALFAQRGTRPGWQVEASCCWRGYVGTWRVEGDRLYLERLRSFRDACNIGSQGTPLLAGVPALTTMQSRPATAGPSLQAVFPDANGPVFANWYSGPLVCPLGGVIHRTGGGYIPLHARERRFWVDQGRIVGDRIRDNEAPGIARYWLQPQEDVAGADSGLSSTLIDAYRDTTYRAQAGDDAVYLRIGIKSKALLGLYDQQSSDANVPRSATFITAWNPFSEECCAQENAAANAALEDELKARECAYFHGEGQGTDPRWAPEASFLALGLTQQAAIDLGRRTDQNAIVFAGDDAVPRLLLLR